MCIYLCRTFSSLKSSPWPAHESDVKLWVTIWCFLSSPADSAERGKESPQQNSSPQSSLFSFSLCNWRAFLHCLRNDSLLFYSAQQKTTPQCPGLCQPSPLLLLSHFTQINGKVTSSPDFSATFFTKSTNIHSILSASHPPFSVSHLSVYIQLYLTNAINKLLLCLYVFLGAGHFLCLFQLAWVLPAGWWMETSKQGKSCSWLLCLIIADPNIIL